MVSLSKLSPTISFFSSINKIVDNLDNLVNQRKLANDYIKESYENLTSLILFNALENKNFKLFKYLDKNKDGKLADEELGEIHSLLPNPCANWPPR